MKAIPTLDQGLRIIPEGESDWTLLKCIVQDAQPLDLAEKFSKAMDEESCWEDIVTPELETLFTDQIQGVVDLIKNEPEEGFTIEQDKLMDWYGALNQARLELESRYSLSDLDINQLNTFPPQIRMALIRSNSYMRIQSLIFEFKYGSEFG